MQHLLGRHHANNVSPPPQSLALDDASEAKRAGSLGAGESGKALGWRLRWVWPEEPASPTRAAAVSARPSVFPVLRAAFEAVLTRGHE